MNKTAECLVQLADELDKKGFAELASQVDELISKYAQNYPDWGGQARTSKRYQLWEKFRAKELTEQQYKDELKKLDDEARKQNDPFLEQKTYRKLELPSYSGISN